MQPINKTAGIVMTSSSYYNRDIIEKGPENLVWQTPKTMISLPESMLDLTNKRLHRFTVVGYMGKGTWQVRCDCGNYSFAKTKTINGSNETACCWSCMRLAKIKRNYEIAKKGKAPDSETYLH